MEKAFDQALSNFTFGMASRDMITHLADEGYSVRQIHDAADYPVSIERVAETVWEHYLETGVIRLDPPDAAPAPRHDYVMDIGAYGRRSFRRVTLEEKPESSPNLEYIALDLGTIKKQTPENYQRLLDALDSRKRDYIDGLPWPDRTVWHIRNVQMNEILAMWEEKGNFF